MNEFVCFHFEVNDDFLVFLLLTLKISYISSGISILDVEQVLTGNCDFRLLNLTHLICFCWKSLICSSKKEIFVTAPSKYFWNDSFYEFKSEYNSLGSAVFRVRSFCNWEMERLNPKHSWQTHEIRRRRAGICFGFLYDRCAISFFDLCVKTIIECTSPVCF